MWPFNKFQLYSAPSAPGHRFVGGAWAGKWQVTWPLAELYVNEDCLILKINILNLIKEEYKFSKNDVIKIEAKRYFPILASGIKIHYLNEQYGKQIIFWYASYKLSNLLEKLKECGWGSLLSD